MIHRWCIGLILGTGLVAGQPTSVRNQAWVLALDGRGGMVGDLKPEEIRVKVDGKVRPLLQVKTPAQTAEAFQSWVLVFEPIRDTNMRATAFLAAADFLTKVPEGDRVFVVARGKDSLESLMPGFSLRRGLWAEALAKVPGMLPEGLVGMSKETLQGMGFQASFADASDGASGQEALTSLHARFRAGAPGWARGTTDQRGVDVLERLQFTNPGFIIGTLATIGRETKALGSIFDLVAPVQGQKHVIVFSRYEADDMNHPNVKRAMTRKFAKFADGRNPDMETARGSVRSSGDVEGPAELATRATGDMTIFQTDLKTRAIARGITLYSVAGAGQNVMGHIGTVAPHTGGFAFPLTGGLDTQFGQGIQVFGSRYLVQWEEDGSASGSGSLDISTTRKDVRVVAQSQK